MGGGYVPILVKSGVREGSKEGTEVTVKYNVLVQRKGPFYYTRFLRGHRDLFLTIGGILWFVLFWYSAITGNVIVFLSAAAILISLALFLPIFLHLTCNKVWVTVEEEKQTTIFFPKISIANVDDVKRVYQGGGSVSSEEGIKVSLYGTEWEHVVKIDDKNEEFWVRGKGDDGEIYVAKFHCADLYNKIKCAFEEKERQWKIRRFEEQREKLEYLERVGRYEEAAQLYETLDMPEKAAEMRRKKREIVVLDLNALIRQLGERGFTITYHCAYCGAPLSISGETKAETIQHCSHCGSRIETIDVANFIKKYLS